MRDPIRGRVPRLFGTLFLGVLIFASAGCSDSAVESTSSLTALTADPRTSDLQKAQDMTTSPSAVSQTDPTEVTTQVATFALG